MGFYGNLANVARTTFSFDKTYSTRWEMMLECKGDQVFIGRYVLLDYDHEDNSSDDVYDLVRLVQWIRENHPESNWDIVEKNGDVWKEIAFPENKNIDEIDSNTYYIVAAGEATFQSPKLYLNNVEQTPTLPVSISDWYNSHYYIDKKIFDSVGRGWDSTVWQKTYKDDDLAYVMIAELNGVVPTIDLTIEPPVWLSDDELEKVYTENLKNGENKTYNASWDGTNWVYSESGYTLDEQNIDLQGDYILLNNDIYVYNYLKRQKYTDPYFDEEDKTNLYYLLHMHRPWRFGLGALTGVNPKEASSNSEDNVSITYSISGTTYPYNETNKVPPTTAPDTMNFNFNFPSIGNALKNINDLLYGEDCWDLKVDPWNKDTNNSGINYNKNSFYPDFNTSAFNSVAGALNSLVDLIGHNIVNAGDGITNFPAGNIYYGSYINLTHLNDVTADDVVGYTPDNSTEDGKNRYWYQYYDKDFGVQKYYYRELIGYPSYNDILLSLHQNAANALDTVDDLRRLAEGITGIPGTLLVTDDDYRIGGLTLNGNNPIIVDEQFSQGTEKNNYLPYPVDWCSVGENGTVIYDVIENLKGLKFEINDNDKSFSVSGTATEDVELIIAANVYLPIGEYILSGSIGGGDLNNNVENYGLKAIKNNGSTINEYKVLSGDSEIISVTSPDFYFDYVKVFINKDVALLNQQFYPMIRKSTASFTYYPYANEYTLNISHKEVETENANIKDSEYNLLDNGAEIDEISALYEPTIDNYGHVIKLKKGIYPKAFTELNLITEKQKTTIGNNNNEVNIVPLQYLAKNSDILSFTLNGVEIEQVPQEQGDYSNIELNIKTTNYPFAIGNIDGIENDYTNPLISNLSFDNTNKVLNATYLNYPYPLSFISVGPLPQSVDNNDRIINWTNNTPGNERQYIYTPTKKNITYISQKMYDNEGHLIESRTDSAVGKVISFSPADDYIKLGVLKDANAGNNIGNEAVVVGHSLKSTNNFNASNYFGEIDNLFPRQRNRLSIDSLDNIDGMINGVFVDKDSFFNNCPKITEHINLTEASDPNGIFQTLSLKLDQAGHIEGIQQIDVKLNFESVFESFIAPVAISPFCSKFYHGYCVDGDPALDAQGRGSGAYSIGDKIYLNRNQSIKNYLYIGMRSGMNHYSPAGGGVKMDYFPTEILLNGNPVQIVFRINAQFIALNVKWYNSEADAKEWFEIIGNTTWYIPSSENLRDTSGQYTGGPLNITAGFRGYNYYQNNGETLFKFATVSSDEDSPTSVEVPANHDWIEKKWPKTGTGASATVSSPYESTDNTWNSLKYTRSVNNPWQIGLRQIFGIGRRSSAINITDEPDDSNASGGNEETNGTGE